MGLLLEEMGNVEKGMGKGGCSGQCWLFTFEKLLEAHKKILPTSFSSSIRIKEGKVQQHFREVASCYLHSVSFAPKTWGLRAKLYRNGHAQKQ